MVAKGRADRQPHRVHLCYSLPVRRSFLPVLAVFWLVAVSIAIALVLEVAIVVERRWSERELEAKRDENPFQAREVSEAFHDSLWETRWEYYRKGGEERFLLGDLEYHVQINSLGFRTAEFSVDKPRGRIRIICVGASTTVQGRINSETYPAHLQRLLRERYPEADLEVLNFGISGTKSNYWLKEHNLFEFSPDIIVQYNAINDIAWRFFQHLAREHPWRKTLNGSHLAQRLFPLDPKSMDPLLLRTLDNFRELKRRATEHGADYVVGSFAVAPFDKSPPEFQRLLDSDVSRWGRAMSLKTYRQLEAVISHYNEMFRIFTRRNDLLTALVDDQFRDPALFIDACHMTSKGIEQLARAFLPSVSKLVEARLGG